MQKATIPQSHVGLLYEDGVYRRTLDPGKHEFKKKTFQPVDRNVVLLDMRERSLTIKGQEILTADKVAIRVSLLVYFKVQDPVAALHNVASYEDRIYEDVQLAARRCLASKTLEAILIDRNEISDAVSDDVKGSAFGYGVAILRADVKDLVFPGNLREIMNQVLETERRAEAKLIEARKEAEAAKVRSEAENQARLQRLKAEKEEARLRSETEKELFKLRMEADIEQARALSENPQLIKLRQLEVLRELSKTGGGKFVIGLQSGDFGSLLSE